MIERSESVTNIVPSLLAFQGEVRAVKRDGNNPHFKSKYATLENVMDAVKPALNKHGIVVIQAPASIVDGAVCVTTSLFHESGEFITATLHVPLGKRDPQGVGSAITYGLRYSLMAMLGLPPTDDDDGENAMDRQGDYAQNRKSSAALKREDAWAEFQADLDDCNSPAALERCKDEWRKKVKEDGWNRAWIEAMPDAFSATEQQIMDAINNQETA